MPGSRRHPSSNGSTSQCGSSTRRRQQAGVVVTSVEKDCEARDLGVFAGDVVVAVQGVKVTTPEQVRQAVFKAHDQGRPFAAVLINGKSGIRWVPIALGGRDVP
jgi:S1-C subfamily serine protease